MATIAMNCPLDGCDYTTGEHSEPVAIAYFNAHLIEHQRPQQVQTTAPVLNNQQVAATSSGSRNGPKLDRPNIAAGVSMEEWIMFKRRWNIYKDGSGILDAQAPHHLFQCADLQLGDALLKTDPDILW